MKCHKCQFENPRNEKFCLNCGEPLKAAQKSTDESEVRQLNLSWIFYLLVGIVLVLILLVFFGIIRIPDFSGLIKPEEQKKDEYN